MNYRETAEQILQHMGGKDNISAVTYCMTRLRMTPKDKGLVDEEALRGISGIVGLKIVGAQYQVIIGPDVEYVYKEFCQQGGFNVVNRINENMDEAANQEKEKLTPKKILDNVMDAIGACVAR